MVSLIPRDQIAGIGHSVVLNFAFTYGMIALFALFIAYKLSESIADRIIGVALQMETIRKGRPEPLELTAAGNDEIGVLSGTYNYMTAEINQLIMKKKQPPNCESRNFAPSRHRSIPIFSITPWI